MKRNEKEKGLFSDPRCHGNRTSLDTREVMERIRMAPVDSPIIVYRGNTRGALTTAFGATIRGMNDADRGFSKNGERVVGVFHGGISQSVVLDILNTAWDDTNKEQN